MDVTDFLKQFHDYLAPKLDTYEQAIYLYIFRHSRLIGKEEVVIGFKSARIRIALGSGTAGSPMSEHTSYVKLRSLETKGCLQLRGSERSGTRIKVFLPEEIPNLLPDESSAFVIDIECADFFNVRENRELILERDGRQCFYCLCKLSSENYVVEHVVSRPAGDNGYRNVVAACRQCNNRKGSTQAEDFLRSLYREGFLSDLDFSARLVRLGQLREGYLRPKYRSVGDHDGS